MQRLRNTYYTVVMSFEIWIYIHALQTDLTYTHKQHQYCRVHHCDGPKSS